MNCKHCGEPITEGTKFCVNCGNKIEVEETVRIVDEPKVEEFKEPERVDAEVVSEGIKPSQPEEHAEPDTSYERVHASETNTNTAYGAAGAAGASGQAFQGGSFAQGPAQGVPQGAPQGPMGYSIASLVCGILGLLCCCCGIIGIILSGAAVALGIVSINKNCEGKGMAIAGIVCGGLGLLFTLGAMITSAVTGGFGLNNLNDLDDIADFLESL